jgi:hypothetical protein
MIGSGGGAVNVLRLVTDAHPDFRPFGPGAWTFKARHRRRRAASLP